MGAAQVVPKDFRLADVSLWPFPHALAGTLVARGLYECKQTGDGSKSLRASRARRPHFFVTQCIKPTWSLNARVQIVLTVP